MRNQTLGSIIYFIVIFSTCFWFDKLTFERERNYIHNSVIEKMSTFRAQIESKISHDLMIIKGLSTYIELNPELDSHEFSEFASALLKNSPTIKNLAAAPDLVIKYIYPLKGNEQALGLDYRANEKQKNAALLVEKVGKIIIAGPIKLLQGGDAFVARMPIFIKSKEKNMKEFWGVVSAPIHLNDFLDSANIKSIEENYIISIRGKDSKGKDGDVFYGPPNLFDNAQFTQDVHLPYGSWQLTGKLKKETTNNYEVYIWLSGTLVYFIILFLLYRKELFREEKKKYYEKTKESEELFRNLFEGSPLGLALCRMDGSFILANNAYLNIVGYDFESLLKKDYWDITPIKYEEQEKIQLKKITESGKYGPYQKQYVHKSGELRDVLLSGFTLIQKDGEKVLWSFVEDITERLKTQSLLLEAKKQAELATKIKGDFLANMSHEIKTPMNGILGAINILQESGLNSEQSEFAQIVSHSAESLLVIINDILDFSKIDEGKMIIEKIPMNYRATIDDTINLLKNSANSKGLALNINIEKEVPSTIISDPARLNQILINLISNSIKFTEKGSIDISVSIEALSDNNLILRTQVMDTGIGMTNEQTNRIFESFMQADNTTSRKFGGTGLGTSICKKIIELMNGKIQVSSEINVGSTVSFEIPVERSFEVIKKNRKNKLKRDYNKVILVAEDNFINQKIVLKALSDLGLKIHIANNGQEVIELSNSIKHDLILMDIQMPILNGIDATKKLIAEGYSKPIIALTANVMESDIKKYFSIGIVDFIAKPFEVSQLIKILDKYL